MAHQVAHKQHGGHHIQQHDIEIKLVVLLVIPPLPLLDGILLKMHIQISNVMVHINKERDCIVVMCPRGK
jgi:hypothetical protein